MEDMKWYGNPHIGKFKPMDSSVAIVTLPVEMYFEFSDKIVDEVDEEGNVISYKSGYLMKPLNNTYVYSGQDAIYLSSVMKEK